MDLGIDKIAKLPNKQKIALLVLLLLVEVAALFFLLLQPKYKELKGLQEQLAGLQQQVQENRVLASRLPILQKEYDQLSRQLEAALTELPNQKEIPKLV